MRINEYLSNPLGKGSAVFQIKNMSKLYTQRYAENKMKIKHHIHDVKGRLYYHIKVPSSIDDIYYDVVIKFIPNSSSAGKSIFDMDFQVFSNCPSFIFTYANAYYKRGLIIPEIKRKLSEEAIKNTAQIRNPYQIIGYEYSIYLALKYIVDNKLTDLDAAHRSATKSVTLVKLLKDIQEFDSLMKRRALKEKVIREQEREEKKKKFTNVSKPKVENQEPAEEKDINAKTVKDIKTSKTIKQAHGIKKVMRK